ncbi:MULTISPECIES: hypothetical protein [unclassified Acinetobacter]|uniref:hypothetical protein n=1 Tax=Acinetobacter TaxID=469 RepID=UPI0018ABA4CC|nr:MULTISPECIES: hypothetical protein [unclassified Acinetobacter]MBJ9954786.1 hypothetical protein [Acinetobacter baumannii]
MFITAQLNVLTQFLSDHACSTKVINQLNQKFVNFEATLLRAKVLREFSEKRHISIIQSEMTTDQTDFAYLFAPFILANLNQTVLYTSPLTDQLQSLLKPYYQIEKAVNLTEKDETVLESLKLRLDFQHQALIKQDFICFELFKALTQSEIQTIFLITDHPIDIQGLYEIECFFRVRIFLVRPQDHQSQRSFEYQTDHLNMQQLLFKYKDAVHIELCREFSEMNARILSLLGLYDIYRAQNLVEDMFYSEHIYEKLSVYAEYMQTKLQNNVLSPKFKSISSITI